MSEHNHHDEGCIKGADELKDLLSRLKCSEPGEVAFELW